MIGKVHYEKPTAVDLGPAAPVIGASRVDGRRLETGYCDRFGNSADQCTDGHDAGVGCQMAMSAPNPGSVCEGQAPATRRNFR